VVVVDAFAVEVDELDPAGVPDVPFVQPD